MVIMVVVLGSEPRVPHMLSGCSAAIHWVIISQQRTHPLSLATSQTASWRYLAQQTRGYFKRQKSHPRTLLDGLIVEGSVLAKEDPPPKKKKKTSREFPETAKHMDLPGRITIQGSETFRVGSRLEGGGCTEREFSQETGS